MHLRLAQYEYLKHPMKLKITLFFSIIAVVCPAALAQSVVVVRKKVTYTRRKPISEYKKDFTVNYPKVRAATPALSKKIENALAYDVNLKEELTGAQWLEEADYQIGYNRNGILSVTLTINGSGAYPSGSTKHVVVDLASGSRVTPAAVFVNLSGLLNMVRRTRDKEVAQAIIDVKKDPDFQEQNAENIFEEHAKYNPLSLKDFGVGEKGVTFYYDYGFPHVIQAMQPAGEFIFTWKQLQAYIKPGGLLARVAR